jgi:hypothetical protein
MPFLLMGSTVAAQNNLQAQLKPFTNDALVLSTSPRLLGDFNNDGIVDIAVLARYKTPQDQKPMSDTRLMQTTYLCGPGPSCKQDIKLNQPGLLILHGKVKGWEKANPEQFSVLSVNFLRGRNNVFAFQEAYFSEKKIPVDITRSKKGKTKLEFSTEASEGILEWKNGRYTWYETQ